MMDFWPQVVQFSIPFIFILLIIALSVVLSYLVYRQTNPSSNSFVRIFLATLRTLLLLILMILFFKPKLFVQFFETKKKNVALLIDYSASSAWQDENENRIDSVKVAINKIESIASGYDINLNKTFFNQTVMDKTDSLDMPFGTTNFKNVFDYLKSSDNEIAVLVSDGIRTEGILPQINRIAVNTVGIGRKSPLPDVFVDDVIYEPVVYQGKEQSIQIKVSSQNMTGSDARLFLFQGNKLLTSKNITLTQSGIEQEIEFTYKPQQPGLQRFKVEIQTDAEDSNIQNNSFVYSQEIIKNKIRIGIFSTVPNNEHKFLNFLLSTSENFEIYSYIKINNRLTENYPVDSLDILILQGYPGKNTTQTELNRITNSIKRNRQGLVFFLDDYTDENKIKILGLDQIASAISRKSKPVSADPAVTELNHLLLRLYDEPALIGLFFSQTPPLTTFFDLTNLKNNANVLIESTSGSFNEKNMIISEANNRKMIVMNGKGFWRWHFALQKNDKIRKGYYNLLVNMMRWTANKNKFQPVVLTINKNSVHPGQEIILDGRLFDSQNNPIKKGQMTITAQAGGQKFTIPMDADSSGQFNARYTPVNEGSYLFTATGITDGKEIGIDRKNMTVVPYNREFIRTNQDSAFLNLIAHNSGGQYYTLSNLDSLEKQFASSGMAILVKNEIELRFKSWLLYFTIIIAVIEWTYRKKHSLP